MALLCSGLAEGFAFPAVAAQRPADGEAVEAAGAVALASARKKKKKYISHIVNVGETLYSIARRYGVPVGELKSANPGVNFNDLQVGTALSIDMDKLGSASVEEIKREEARSAGEKGRGAGQEDKKAGAVPGEKEPVGRTEPERPQENAPAVRTEYAEHLVAPGETLYGLSRRYGTTIEALLAANPGIREHGLRKGEPIRIPVQTPVPGSVPVPSEPVSETPPVLPAYPVSEGLRAEGDTAAAAPEREAVRYYGPAVTPRVRKHFDERTPIVVSLILPLKGTTEQHQSFVRFYEGFLLAVDSLKREGVSIDLHVYNTPDRTAESAAAVLAGNDLSGSDIIIGPVYEEQFCEVAAFGGQHGIPVVSPLAAVGCSAPGIFQVAPADSLQYEKARRVLGGERNVVLITTDNDDNEFLQAVAPLLPPGYQSFMYYRGIPTEKVNSLLDEERENVFVLATASEVLAEEIMARLSSIQNTYYTKQMSLFGPARLVRHPNIDMNLFFKLNTRFVTSYHADRGNADIRYFDKLYLSTYKKLPSLYSYRGYDVGLFFLGSLKEFGSDFFSLINDYRTRTLQTLYRFKREPSGKYTNVEWMLVNYTPQYTITAE